jgi:hypothetical protein
VSKSKYNSFEECIKANKDNKDPVAHCVSVMGSGNSKQKKGNSTVSMARLMLGGK